MLPPKEFKIKSDKKIKPKKCRICPDKFTPVNHMQICCSTKCAIEYAKSKTVLKEKKNWREQKAVLKEKLKGVKEYKVDLQKEINTICRILDKGAGCISCGNQGTPQAGHYHTTQAHGTIRYNLHNLHTQCYSCNCEKAGNIHAYDLGLIDRYGKEYWELVKFELTSKYPYISFKEAFLREKIPIARQIVKELQKADLTYPPKIRIEMRESLNKRIGIY